MTEDKHIRSVIKGISWRVLATIATILIVVILTGNLVLSLSIGLLETLIKLALYYGHERAWNNISWGKIFN